MISFIHKLRNLSLDYCQVLLICLIELPRRRSILLSSGSKILKVNLFFIRFRAKEVIKIVILLKLLCTTLKLKIMPSHVAFHHSLRVVSPIYRTHIISIIE